MALPIGHVTNGGARWDRQPRMESSDATWPLYRFVVDDRFPESIAAGRAAVEHGAPMHVMSGGDITPFWFNDRSLQWRQGAAVVAGVTAHGPLFVL